MYFCIFVFFAELTLPVPQNHRSTINFENHWPNPSNPEETERFSASRSLMIKCCYIVKWLIHVFLCKYCKKKKKKSGHCICSEKSVQKYHSHRVESNETVWVASVTYGRPFTPKIHPQKHRTVHHCFPNKNTFVEKTQELKVVSGALKPSLDLKSRRHAMIRF